MERAESPNALALLADVSAALDTAQDLRAAMEPVLAAMGRHAGVDRCVVTLLNRHTQEILVDASRGLTAGQRKRGRYQLGEGVTGRVVQSGCPALIPSLADEPLFLDRTGARQDLPLEDIAFLCVPIRLGNEVIGALSVDRTTTARETLDAELRLWAIVASMIAYAVRLRQLQEEERALHEENERLRRQLGERYRAAGIVGNSKEMINLHGQIEQVAPADTTVLIQGESGTGKELIASAIHFASPRASGPFVRVNCAALPESLLESELFGHERGAFTGALQQRKGRFEMAHRGTLFLDEVGELSASAQVRLLRVLQERNFERVGGNSTIHVDVRVLAATNRDLQQAMESGAFRPDLFWRLNVFPVHVPALRDRRTDIVPLADHFVGKYNRRQQRDVQRLSTPAIELLTRYHWPGNVRELENAIERAVLVADGSTIHAHHLPPSLQMAQPHDIGRERGLAERVEAYERELILDALKAHRGNRAAAARALGITERIMGLRVHKYGLTDV